MAENLVQVVSAAEVMSRVSPTNEFERRRGDPLKLSSIQDDNKEETVDFRCGKIRRS